MERAAGAALDALNLVSAIYYRRRSGLHLLKEVELLQCFPAVRADLDRLSAALAGAEWALAVLPKESPEERIYGLTLNFLGALDRGHPPRLLGLRYVLRLLAAAGHGPSLDRCAVCGRVEDLTWSPERGGGVCRACGGAGVALSPRLAHALAALRRLPLSAVARLRLEEEDLAQAEALLKSFRQAQLGH